MAKVYRISDRIGLKVGPITVKISPLTIAQKAEVQSLMLEGQKASDIVKLNAAMILALRYCLKEVNGLEDTNGPYSLVIEDGMVSEACADDLTNLEFSPSLLKACAAFVNSIPKTLDIDGVEFLEKKLIPEA